MRAMLRSGHKVLAFLDFNEANEAGLKSRSSWRQKGRVVPDDAIPSGIVIKKHGKARKVDGPWFEPVLIPDVDNEFVQLVVDWFEVFSEENTRPKQISQEVLIPIICPVVFPEGGRGRGEGSSMTPKESQQFTPKTVTTNGEKTGKPCVNNVRAYVPEELVLPDNCPVKEQIWWFLGLIYWKHLEQRLPWHKPIYLKYDYLKENIPNWPEVWRWCEGRLVERIGGYTPGLRSYGYRTAEPYRDQAHRLKTFEHKLLAKRLKATEAKHFSRPILLRLRQQLERLTIDMDGFQRQCGHHPDHRYYSAHLQTVCDRELRFTKDEFSGRIHTNVTNMYKPLRKFLRVDNEPDTLGETDIRNSQPLFLGMLAKSNGVNDQQYMNLCEEGQFYEHLATKLGLLRESTKDEMMVVLYGRNGYRSAAKRLFGQEFPAMAEFIKGVKANDHCRLSRLLQEEERRFVVDTVCVRLFQTKKDLFLTTIHDALLARKQDCDLVVSIMKDEFAKRGVHPRLEWKDVSESG